MRGLLGFLSVFLVYVLFVDIKLHGQDATHELLTWSDEILPLPDSIASRSFATVPPASCCNLCHASNASVLFVPSLIVLPSLRMHHTLRCFQKKGFLIITSNATRAAHFFVLKA